MSIVGSIGAFVAGILLFPAARIVRSRRAAQIPEPEIWADDAEIDAFIFEWHQKGIPVEEMARRLALAVSDVSRRVSRIPVPISVSKPVPRETEIAEACRKLANSTTGSGSKRDESVKWIKDFHAKYGELPSWTKTRKTLGLSGATATRYRAQAAMELGLVPEAKAA